MLMITVTFHFLTFRVMPYTAFRHGRHRTAGIGLEVFFVLEVIGHAVRVCADDCAGLINLLAADRIDCRS